jgi:hypothetical protein
MSDTKKSKDLNDVTRDLVEAKAAGDQNEVDYLTGVSGLFGRHPRLMTDPALFKRASDRDEELRQSGASYYPERYEQIADELDGVRDPVVDALGAAIDGLDVTRAEALVRLVRTGRLVPQMTPEQFTAEDGPDDQTAIGIMASMRAPTQILMAQARKMKVDLT